jgi:hypothetical protein
MGSMARVLFLSRLARTGIGIGGSSSFCFPMQSRPVITLGSVSVYVGLESTFFACLCNPTSLERSSFFTL